MAPAVERPLAGRRAAVTGAARGLGAAFARHLHAAGASVVCADRQQGVHDLAADLGDGAIALTVDVSHVRGAQDLMTTAAEIFKGTDLLINNAGRWRMTPVTADLDHAAVDYREMVNDNLGSAFLCGRAAIPYLRVADGGDIINIASDHVHHCGWPTPVEHFPDSSCPWADLTRFPGGGSAMDIYDAAKWGLLGLTFDWARALRHDDIRVNALCVGPTDTPMLREALGGPPSPESVGAWLTPDDVANVLVGLLCQGSDGPTGAPIGVWPGHPLPFHCGEAR